MPSRVSICYIKEIIKYINTEQKYPVILVLCSILYWVEQVIAFRENLPCNVSRIWYNVDSIEYHSTDEGLHLLILINYIYLSILDDDGFVVDIEYA